MNAPAIIARPRPLTPLKAWRKRQMVDDAAKGCRRTMVITDIPRLYDIAVQTWQGWEQAPGSKGFRRPDDHNMQRLFEITGGEIRPEHFYRVEEWEDRLAVAREQAIGR